VTSNDELARDREIALAAAMPRGSRAGVASTTRRRDDQASAAQRWLEARTADLLPVERGRALRPAVRRGGADPVDDAADPKHLGARIGATLVQHTWGSALTHHPHVHGIVPGGGLSLDGQRWIACRRGFFLPVRVLSRLFRRLFLEALLRAHRDGQLVFFGEHATLADAVTFARWLSPLRQCEWVVYAKRTFAGPQAVLAYLSRHTYRVAISNSRLIALDECGVTLRWKDYRAKGRTRYKAMRLDAGEFMRRFPAARAARRLPPHSPLRPARQLQPHREPRPRTTAAASPTARSAARENAPDAARTAFVCPHCGDAMIVVQVFGRVEQIRAPPPMSLP
jgi:predicted RNA-binding Zn-ribbon protein involved in translation (DUF1610 family)